MSSTPNLNEDVRFQLGTISGKLDMIMSQNAEADRRNTERMAKMEDRADGQDARLDALEKNQSRLLGAGAAVAGLFTAVTTIVGLSK